MATTEPSGGAGGQASDISIVASSLSFSRIRAFGSRRLTSRGTALQANEILRVREKMFDLYADHCKFADEDRETARQRFGAYPLS